jgi:hypothetical protein
MRSEQYMNMVGYHHPGMQLIMAQSLTSEQTVYYNLSDCWLAQEKWPTPGCI